MTKKFNIGPILSLLLELAGLAAIVFGCYLLSPVLGFIIGGIATIIVGLAIDPPNRRNNSGVGG